jgi:PAS domain S-box-containing protein
MSEKAFHILLVEDEEAHAEMVCRAFQSRGGRFLVTVAKTLVEARDHLEKLSPDLVIADLVLPDGKGTDLTPNDRDPEQFPVVVMTSHGDEQMAVKTMKAGALDYIVKSVETLSDIPHVAERTLREWRNIVERKRAEKMLDQFFNLSIDMLCVADLEGHFKYVNPAFEKTLGHARTELLSKSYMDFVHPDDKVATLAAAQELVQGVPSINFVNRYILKDGTYKWLEWTSMPHPRAGVFYAVARDITKDKLATEERSRLEAQLQQAQKMEAIGTLAGGIAHDFNNILGAIMGYTELGLLDAPEGSRLKTNLNQVLRATDRAKNLVRQILAFSRQSEQEEKPVLLAPIIKEALKMLRASIPTTIDIRQNITQESGTVLADPTQIHQVLMNLCTNAAHAMRETGGILEVALEDVGLTGESAAEYPDLEPGAYERLTVRDTGHGMSHTVKKRVFDPYFTTKEKGVGTGLGLAAVHGIVQSFNGGIFVDSEPGKGATFQVLLPRIDTKVVREVKTTEPLPTGSERILLVDDEETLIQIGKAMLERLGYTVVTKTSSVEALEAFGEKPHAFDLVITDQTMPHLTGEKLAKGLMQIRKNIPIILCTGYSQLVTGEKAKAAGVREFVMKPLVMRDFAETVQKVLDKA